MRINAGSSLRRVTKKLIKKNNALWSQVGDPGFVRHGDETYYVDEDGNETYHDSHPEEHGLFKDGDTASMPSGPREKDPQIEIDMQPIEKIYSESMIRKLVREIVQRSL